MTPRPLSILLAEDTPANQKIITKVLEDRGHHVTIAADGREAVEHAAKSRFDVILMDLRMPVMDGYEAVDAIRAAKDQSHHRLPIIALTANSSARDREACFAAGMEGCIAKPFDVGELIAVVESAVERRCHAESGSANTAGRGNDGEPLSQIADLAATMKRLGGDQELMRCFIEVFHEDAPALLQNLRSGIAEDDAVKVSRAAHTLRGLISNFSAPSVTEQVALIESMAKQGNLKDADLVLKWLSARVTQLGHFLDSHHPSRTDAGG